MVRPIRTEEVILCLQNLIEELSNVDINSFDYDAHTDFDMARGVHEPPRADGGFRTIKFRVDYYFRKDRGI